MDRYTHKGRGSDEKRDEAKEKLRYNFFLSRLTFIVCFLISTGLIVGGFFVPPIGVIDGSVLTAVGELLLFPTLLYGFRAVEMGMRVRFQKGETRIMIEGADDSREEFM